MKSILLIMAIFSVNSNIINSQIRTSVSNLLRYGNGEQTLGSLSNEFKYFENLTDVRLGLPQNVIIGFRFLYDEPPEVGKPFNGISRRFIEYKRENLRIRIGNSSELYGRGLVLNLFENRGLAFDTWVDGIKASYKMNNFKASLIAGTVEFTDSISIYRTEKYKLRGGNIEYQLLKSTKLGLSFLSVNSDIPQFDNSLANVNAELPELYIDINKGPFGLFFNWAHKWTNASKLKTISTGSGIYSALSYAGSSFGITVEYKNYKFDQQNPLSSNDETRTSKYMPFQNPPIVMKEHSYTLLSRALHQVDFNDEVGIQVEANYVVNSDLNFNLNYSMASLHNSYLYNNENFVFDDIKRDDDFLPSSKKEFAPFREIFGEVEYYFNFDTAIRFGVTDRSKTIYNFFTGKSGSHTIKSTVIPVQFQHLFSENFSAVIQYEFEAVNDNFNTGQKQFNNQFLSIVTSIFRKVTAAVRFEITNNKFDASGRKDWLLGEIGYRISGRNLATISYGRERGGQVCSNGICRYILPFKGLRFTLQTAI